MKKEFVSITIKGITLLGKLLLMVSIAKYLSLDDMGIYALIVAAISYAKFLLGFEFSYFSQRELLRSEKHNWVIMIRDQFVVFLFVYAIVLPLLLIIFYLHLIQWQYIVWFYVLLVLEHLNQEIFRLLVVLSKPVLANIVQFLNGGFWAFIFTFLVFFWSGFRNLTTIWILWFAGGLLSLTIGAFGFKNLQWEIMKYSKTNWLWIKTGIKTALPFLGIAMALKAIEFADRFFIQYYNGESSVGIYFFFISIAGLPLTIIDASIGITLGPQVIASYQKGKFHDYTLNYRKLVIGSVVLLTIIGICLAMGIYFILELTHKSQFKEFVSVYWLLLCLSGVTMFSNFVQLSMYVRNLDIILFLSIVIILIFSLLLNFSLIPKYGLQGAALSKIGAMFLLGAIRLFWLKIRENKSLKVRKM